MRKVTLASLLGPIGVLTGGLFGIIAALLAFAADRQDALAIRASVHLARTALGAETAALQGFARDYAVWDAAVESLVVTLDEAWASQNIGEWAHQSLAVDATLVLDGADRPFYVMVDGVRQPNAAVDRATVGLAPLVDAARAKAGRPTEAPASGFVLFDGVPAIASAAAIRWEDGRAATGRGGAASVLVYLRLLDGELLASLQERYLLANLRLGDSVAGGREPGLALASAAGVTVGYLLWQAERPGLVMLRPLILPGLSALLVAAILLVTIVRRAQRAMQDLATGFDVLQDQAQSLRAARDDAEAQRRVEAELRTAAATASRAKSEFLALVSHELRTPLNSILGFADMISSSVRGDGTAGKVQEYAGYIRQSGDSLLSLINDIIDLARAESDRLQMREREIALREVLERCVTLLHQQALDRGVEVRCRTAELVVRADQRAIKQIVTNLLSNAIKFTARGGRIDVFAEPTSDFLEIGIRDTGAGMTDAEMLRALEAFGQAELHNTRAASGPGLGLNITRVLAEAHGGQLVLRSVAGVGTIATIRLPLERLVRSGIRERTVISVPEDHPMVAAARSAG